RFWVAAAAFGGFGLAGALAAGRQVGYPVALVAAAVATGAGLCGLVILLRAGGGAEQSDDPGRRAFLKGAGAVLGLAVLSAGAGRLLIERAKLVVSGREEVVLPDSVAALPAPAAAASLEAPGVTPIVTPNDQFYRIDTALSVPRVALADWSLRITGMVGRPHGISFADLLDLDMVERYITLSCVSNQVGGDLVGNAKWLGVPLREVLDRARPQPGAEQVVGRSVDGFTVGFPIEAVYDGREALVAVGMNGEPLPFDHGFPARLVVAGLYGYVSATKWLSEIELTTWDGFDAYWVPRGWSKEGPIKTQSRIDTPRHGSQVPAGPKMVAGVAWAPHRGISRVEVQIDEDAWQEAELSEALSEDTWVQWALTWEATTGSHRIRVRATDGAGDTQTSQIVPPAPDGATGWHTIRVRVG
ncbi:MAG: molybdopterin-dependent oxidoreductase, partial [Acidimicrobiia bacterium]